MKNLKYIMLGLHLLLFGPTTLSGQDKVHVMTKKVTREFQPRYGEGLFVQAENAVININAWDEPKVSVELTLTSKSLDKELAEKEMDYHRYAMDRFGRKIRIKNFFSVPTHVERLQSLLQCNYEIYIPREMYVNIKNYYGKIFISDKRGVTNIESEYCDIHLENIYGTATVNNFYGDLTAKNINGNVTGDFNNTIVEISGISGKLDINSVLGEVMLEHINVSNISVAGSKSDITIYTDNTSKFEYQFNSKYGSIEIPVNLSNIPVVTVGNEQQWQRESPSHDISIDLKTEFGDIKLKQQ